MGISFGFGFGVLKNRVSGGPPANDFLNDLYDAFEFDEASGTVVNKVTTDRNATKINTPTQSASGGVTGGHIDFPTAIQYLTYGDTTTHKFMHYGTDGTDMLWSMEFWLKFPTTPGDLDTQHGIFSNVSTTTQAGVIWKYTDISGSGNSRALELQILRASSGTRVIIGDVQNIYPNDTNWNQVILTYDQSLASNNAKIYVNGSLAGNITKSGLAGGNANSQGTQEIGNLFGTSLGLITKMDMFRIWKTRIITSDEATALYNSGSGVAYSNFG